MCDVATTSARTIWPVTELLVPGDTGRLHPRFRQQYLLDLARVHLLSPDVDALVASPEEVHAIAGHLDEIARRVQPGVVCGSARPT